MSDAWEKLKRQLSKIQGAGTPDTVLQPAFHDKRTSAYGSKKEALKARIRQEKTEAINARRVVGLIPRQETMELAIKALQRQAMVARGAESVDAHRLLQTVRKVYARHYG